MILYDKKNQRLAMFKNQATPDFWDKHWQQENLKKSVCSKKVYHFLKPTTTRYIEKGGRILEGGCGIGQIVYNLTELGYDAYGVDFAEQTIRDVKIVVPQLNLSVQDVRNLEFPDNFFDAYWSFGVIEHFWEGYAEILNEAKRVLKPNGYLFLTFPSMSPLRRLKVKLGLYKELNDESINPSDFYEFMLNPLTVRNDLEKLGFVHIESNLYDGLKGLKDEITLFRPALQYLYDGKNIFARILRFLITIIFARFTGHMMLFVFKKQH